MDRGEGATSFRRGLEMNGGLETRGIDYGSAAVYDVQRATNYEAAGLVAKHESIFSVDKQNEHGHKLRCILSHMVVMNFKMPGKVYRTAMSSAATSHMLIAAGTEDVQVRLCDIASGAFTHTLSGHRDGVMTVEWSTSSEWILLTGGCDGAIRFWDIRRAGCFLVLDQSRTQLGKRPPLSTHTSMKGTTSKSFPIGQTSFMKAKAPQKKAAHGNSVKQALGRLPSHNKGYFGHRLHLGMLSSRDRATAHYGAVIGLKVTGDGMHLLSAGSDSRLRLWDIESGCNTLVNYEVTRLQTSRGIQLAVAQDLSLVYVPCMTTVKVRHSEHFEATMKLSIAAGLILKTRTKMENDTENCNLDVYCQMTTHTAELSHLYTCHTGSNDRQILVWSPSKLGLPEADEWDTKAQTSKLDQDSWSD
ncbi:hypothetical protein Syun_014607 [Stephania yunnanensis]|uniref:Transducin/WD40 repeat-like superfamily protein n=1 Tax=Stephania yunnanensis TaxID=152371 RepID=A0AAP0P8Y9_9MAGN